MKKLIASCVIGAIVSVGALGAYAQQESALQREIVAKERQELDDLKSGNYDDFASLVADDAIFMDSSGSATKAEVMTHTREFRLTDYTMSDIKFVRISSSAGIVIYTIDETGTSHGHSFTEKVYVAATWVKRGSKWLSLFSQETAVRKPAQ